MTLPVPVGKNPLMKDLQLVSKTAELSIGFALDVLADQNCLLTEYLQGRGMVSAKFDASTCRIADPYPKGLQKPAHEATYNDGARVDSATVPATKENVVPDIDVLASQATELDRKLVHYLMYAARFTGVLQEIKTCVHDVLILDELKKQNKSLSTARHTTDMYRKVCDKKFELIFISVGEQFLTLTKEILNELLDYLGGQDYGSNTGDIVKAAIQQYRADILKEIIPARLIVARDSIAEWVHHGKPLVQELIDEVGVVLYGPMPCPNDIITYEADQQAVQADAEAAAARREAEKQSRMPVMGREWMEACANGEY